MTGIQYVTNEKGEHVAVQIDLAMHGDALRDFLEDIDDLDYIAKNQNDINAAGISYDEVRAELISKGKL